jgi:RNA polymerase sigma factor (sigma-70 family)
MHIDATDALELETDSLAPFADEDDKAIDLQTETFLPASREIRTVEQLKTFTENHYDDIRRLVRRQCFHTPGQAEDVTQELYPRLAKFLATSPNGIREPWAFIRTAAMRLAIDELRRQATLSRRFVAFHEDSFLPPSADEPADRPEEKEELSRRVRQVIRSLDSQEQTVVTRIFFEGKSGREVAREMDLSESYVAELKADALSRLRGLLLDDPLIFFDRDGVHSNRDHNAFLFG